MNRIVATVALMLLAIPAVAEDSYYRCGKCGKYHVRSTNVVPSNVLQSQSTTQPTTTSNGQVSYRPALTTSSSVTSTAPTPNGQARSYSPFAPSSQWPVRIDARAQSFAEREVRIMAQRGQAGHFLGLAPGATLGGVGAWGGQTSNCPTCVPKPHENKVLIADASYFDSRTNQTYRSRQWR